MDERTRAGLVVAGTVTLFLVIQLGALALVPELDPGRDRVVTDPGDPTNSLAYVGAILVATAGMLVVIRLGLQGIIRGVVILTGGVLAWYVVGLLARRYLVGVPGIRWLPAVGALAVVGGLIFHPEWYVIDAAGVVMGAGSAALFGISFGLLPALVLLVALAVYDAISVYGTGHMLTLAEGMMALRIPVVLVVPATASFSLSTALEGPGSLAADPGDGGQAPSGENATSDEESAAVDDETDPGTGHEKGIEGPADGGADGTTVGEDVGADGSGDDPAADGSESEVLSRNALFVGLGDAVIPTILVVSAAFFLQTRAAPLVGGFALNLPALGALLGTTAGLFALLWMVMKGRAHAGLPLLNGGAIAGYLLGAVAAGIPLRVALGI